jgi:hypothetical protein
MVQRERFEQVCRELWARLGDQPNALETAGAIARVALEAVLDPLHRPPPPPAWIGGSSVPRRRLRRLDAANPHFSADELQLALHVAQTRGAAVDAAAIGYELGYRAGREGREGRDPEAPASRRTRLLHWSAG